MGLRETDECIGILAQHVGDAFREGNPAIFDFTGRPHLRVHNMSPAIYDRYGKLRNRGPLLAGQYAIKGLLRSQEPLDVGRDVAVVFQAPAQTYGFFTQSSELLEGLAEQVGAPAMRFTPVMFNELLD